MNFFRKNSSPCFHLGLASVATFHNVETTLNILQRGTNRRKDLRVFLQRFDLALKKPEFLFLGLVAVFDGLVTTKSA